MPEPQNRLDQEVLKPQEKKTDTSYTSSLPQEDFSLNAENVQELLNREWSENEEEKTWQKTEQEEDRKHKQKLLGIYRKRLRNEEEKKSKLGLGDSSRITIESEIEECHTQIKQLKYELYGQFLSTAEEDQLLSHKQKQIRVQTKLDGQINIEELTNWFIMLPLREKFFVITLSIFNGIKYPDFKDINEILLAEISANIHEEDRERRNLDSYFDSPDDERLKICKAEVLPKDGETEEIIKFIDDKYPKAILGLLRKRYHDLLLDLLPALRKVVERHRYWEIRYWAALAVAEIGKIGFFRIQDQVLAPWATDKRPYVRAAVGYPLALLTEDKSTRDNVRKLLNRWSDPNWDGHPETWYYRWAVASTYKQIGLIGQDWAKDWAYEGLKKIADFNDIRLVDATIHSLVALSLQGQLERVLFTLKEWVNEFIQKQDDKREQINQQVPSRYLIALLAFIVLSEIHTADIFTESTSDAESNSEIYIGNILSLMEEQNRIPLGDVWQLAIDIGISTFKFRLEELFFSLITYWTKYASDVPKYQTTIINLVTEVFIKLETPRHKRHFWNLLQRWEKQSQDKDLAKMALTARSEIKKRIL